MQKYSDVILNQYGRPMPGLRVVVDPYVAGAALNMTSTSTATIYATDGGPAVQSVLTDASGRFAFYAADGRYNLTVTGTGVSAYMLADVTLNDPGDDDASGLNVRRFIDTPIDGVTSNHAGIVAAVNAALQAGAALNWPAGTYVADGNIPGFHDIQHAGGGLLRRGGDLWTISGKSGTNCIYASPTGSASNDGLTASTPRTLQGAFDALAGWSDALLRNGTFRVQLAAGTYNGNVSLIGLRSKNRIVIAGPAAGHPNMPTAVIDGTGISAAVGLYMQANVYAYVQDIKLANWTYGSTAYGMVADGHCDVVVSNVHAANCGYAGMSFDNLTEIRMLGGIIEDCPAYGVRLYSQTSASIGYSGVGAGSSTIIRRCNTGIYGANSVRVHADYCALSNNVTGILVEKNSRAVANYCAFTSNTIAVQYQIASAYGESGATNTFTGNGKNYVSYGGSDEVNAPMNYWDRSASRSLYGASAYRAVNAKFEWQLDAAHSGAPYNSNVKAVFDGNSATNYLGLSGPATSITGFIWSCPNKSAQAVMAYNFNDDTWRLWVSGAYAYVFKSASFSAVTDNVRALGESGLRWSTVYAYNLSLKPPASATPAINGEMTFELTSDTTLKIKVKGSDGVVRAVTLTLA